MNFSPDSPSRKFGEFRSESYESDSNDRADTIMQLCRNAFDVCSPFGTLSPTSPETPMMRQSSATIPIPSSFKDFFEQMTGYAGDIEDKELMNAHFDQMTSQQYAELEDSFKDHDHSQGELINSKLQTLTESFQKVCTLDLIHRLNLLPPNAAHSLLQQLDQLEEILLHTASDPFIVTGHHRYEILMEAARKAFDVYDMDCNGFIEKSEFERVFEDRIINDGFGEDSTLNETSRRFADLQMEKFDTNLDGKVSFEEFLHFFCLDEYEGDRNDLTCIYKYLGSLSQSYIEETLLLMAKYAELH